MPCIPACPRSLGSESVRQSPSHMVVKMAENGAFLSRHLTCAPPFIRSLRLCHCGLGWKRDGHCCRRKAEGTLSAFLAFLFRPKTHLPPPPPILSSLDRSLSCGQLSISTPFICALEIPRYVSVAGNSISRHLLPCCWHSAVHRKGADG